MNVSRTAPVFLSRGPSLSRWFSWPLCTVQDVNVWDVRLPHCWFATFMFLNVTVALICSPFELLSQIVPQLIHSILHSLPVGVQKAGQEPVHILKCNFRLFDTFIIHTDRITVNILCRTFILLWRLFPTARLAFSRHLNTYSHESQLKLLYLIGWHHSISLCQYWQHQVWANKISALI